MSSEYGSRPNPFFSADGNRLVFRYEAETVYIEPWGPNAFRVRATNSPALPLQNWALSEAFDKPDVKIDITPSSATIVNGLLTATVSHRGKITLLNTSTHKILLEEYARHRLDLQDPKCSSPQIEAREWKARLGGAEYHLTARFESHSPREKLFGMGQYQQGFMDLKGADLELAQRNSQASVPFVLSSEGYGLLWNNPAGELGVFFFVLLCVHWFVGVVLLI